MITVYGNTTPRAELPNEVQVPPRAGRFWKGISHRELAETLVKTMNRTNIQVLDEKWVVGKNGRALIGAFDLELPGISALEGQRFSLGIRHSNDLSRAIQVSCGTTVLACHNGVLTGNFVLKKKHTSALNLDAEIEKGVQRYLEEARSVKGIVERMQNRRFTELETDNLILATGRRGLLPWSAVGKLDEEYRWPSTPIFAEWRGTAWGIFNAFNEVTKRLSPFRQLDVQEVFRKMVLN